MKPTLLLAIYQDSRHHFCGKFSHSQIFFYNMSHCFPIHIQLFCYYSHTYSSIWVNRGSSSVHICLCPLHVLAARFLGRPAHLLALPWTAFAIKNHSISSNRIHHKPLLIWLTFHSHFYQSSHKTWYVFAAPDSCHSFFGQPYTTDTHYFICSSGTNESFGMWLM